MAHRHRHRAVRSRLGGQPGVGELRVVGVVRGDHHDLLALVAGLGHPVRVRSAGDRDVGAPHQQVGGVPPVARLRHVGLVAEHLRRGHRQVGVPVVERRHRAADQLDEPRTDRVAHHRHRRDRGETRDAVRPVGPDGVHVRRGDHLHRLVPGDPHVTALAARGLVTAALVRIGADLRPGLHRIAEAGLRLPVHLHQHAARVGVAHPGGRIGVPGERRAARAAPRLVLRRIRPDRRVVGLLRLPGDDPVLDVDLPRARPRAVHPVRGTDDLVVAPPVPVEDVAFSTTLPVHRPQIHRGFTAGEEPPGSQQRICRGPVGAAHRVWRRTGVGHRGASDRLDPHSGSDHTPDQPASRKN